MESVVASLSGAVRVARPSSRGAIITSLILTVMFLMMPALPRITLFSRMDEYLAVHQAIEIFSITVSGIVFAVGWHSGDLSKSGRQLMIGACFLGIGLLNFGHVVSYPGMPNFLTPAGVEKAIWFWIAQRVLLMTCFVFVFFKIGIFVGRGVLMGCVLLFVAVIYVLILSESAILPRTFIQGQGLTSFKVAFEVVSNVTFLGIASIFWGARADQHNPWLACASWILGLGGLYFALYASPYDIYNMMGHVYVGVAYVVLYRGLAQESLRIPFVESREASRLLAAANQELRASRDRLEQGVAERTLDLKLAKEQADLANQAKTEFLSAMSHELRTPLNSVLGFAQLLRTGRPGPLTEKQTSHLDHIIRGGSHLLKLINEVLDLSRIEAGKLNIDIENVDPVPILADCVAQSRVYARRNQVTIEECQIVVPARVRVDYTRFKQVVLNLVSNAVKYNRPGGRVTLSMERIDGGRVRFRVRDTGYGIPQERRAGLFEPFNRLGAEATDIEGAGVGLTITKRLIEAMGGEIGLESVVGEGTCFWFDVPEGEAMAVNPLEPVRGPAIPKMVRSSPDGRVWKILYVEDNPANLFLMESVVADLGEVELSSAHSAEIGLELAYQVRPDLIVIDINMPGMDGIEMVRRLRTRPEFHDSPIIALSANATQSAQRRALEAGFDRYLTKPLDVALFVDSLNALLPGAKA